MEKELHKELQLWRIIGMLRDDILTKLVLTLNTEQIAFSLPMASDACASPPTTLVGDNLTPKIWFPDLFSLYLIIFYKKLHDW